MQKIDLVYKNILRKIIFEGFESEDRRLFHKFQPERSQRIKAINGVVIRFDLGRDGFPLISLRKIPINVFVAETVWFLTGQNDTKNFLDSYTNIWENFVEEDGTVTSYGHRWRRHFGRDQLEGLLNMLELDPGSRHGVVITWDPSNDSLSTGTKRMNVPCQIGFIVNITEGKLNFHGIWRSVDMILGFPYDIAGNALLCHILASHLGVEVGWYTHYIANAHIYETHYSIAKELIRREPAQAPIKLQANGDWFERASHGDRKLVEEIIGGMQLQYTNSGKPISNIKIVI